jgi:WD40 repeat protein
MKGFPTHLQKFLLIGSGLLWLSLGQQCFAQEVKLRATFTGAGLGVAFSPDGKTVVSGGRRAIKLWDVATGKERGYFDTGEHIVLYTDFSNDGKLLASSGNDLTVKLWEVATRKERATLKGHNAPPFSISSWLLRPDGKCIGFSPDSKTLASGGDDTLRLWDVATGKNTATLRSETGVYAVAFSPDGKTLATGGSRQAKLWDVATGKKRAMLEEEATFVCLAFSPDGKELALGSWTGTLTLWNVATGKKRLILTRDDACVYAVAFSPDGKTLAAVEGFGIRLWDPITGKERATLKEHDAIVNSLAFSPDGKILASASYDGTVKLWDVSSTSVK